jgi:hypothetical protein
MLILQEFTYLYVRNRHRGTVIAPLNIVPDNEEYRQKCNKYKERENEKTINSVSNVRIDDICSTVSRGEDNGVGDGRCDGCRKSHSAETVG